MPGENPRAHDGEPHEGEEAGPPQDHRDQLDDDAPLVAEEGLNTPLTEEEGDDPSGRPGRHADRS